MSLCNQLNLRVLMCDKNFDLQYTANKSFNCSSIVHTSLLVCKIISVRSPSLYQLHMTLSDQTEINTILITIIRHWCAVYLLSIPGGEKCQCAAKNALQTGHDALLSWQLGIFHLTRCYTRLDNIPQHNMQISTKHTPHSLTNAWTCTRVDFDLDYTNIPFQGFLFVLITSTSLYSTCMLYRDRQKPANGTWCPTLMTEKNTDLLHALPHRHDNTWQGLF